MSDALVPHRGVMILIFGIVGLVICPPFGIVPWIMGRNDMKLIDSGKMDPTGRGMTQAGMIIGIIATCLAALALLIWGGIFVAALLFAGAAAGAAGH
jgi:hypothetical protein